MKIFSISKGAFPRRSAKTPLTIFIALTAMLIVSAGGYVHAQEAPSAVKVQTEPLLHPLFSENAVLQRDRPVPIWGWTQPQTKVR